MQDATITTNLSYTKTVSTTS